MHVASASASTVRSFLRVPPVGRVFRDLPLCFRLCFWRYLLFLCHVLFVFPVPSCHKMTTPMHPNNCKVDDVEVTKAAKKGALPQVCDSRNKLDRWLKYKRVCQCVSSVPLR